MRYQFTSLISPGYVRVLDDANDNDTNMLELIRKHGIPGTFTLVECLPSDTTDWCAVPFVYPARGKMSEPGMARRDCAWIGYLGGFLEKFVVMQDGESDYSPQPAVRLTAAQWRVLEFLTTVVFALLSNKTGRLYIGYGVHRGATLPLMDKGLVEWHGVRVYERVQITAAGRAALAGRDVANEKREVE